MVSVRGVLRLNRGNDRAGPVGRMQEHCVRAPPLPLYGSRDGTPRTCREQPDQFISVGPGRVFAVHETAPSSLNGGYPPKIL